MISIYSKVQQDLLLCRTQNLLDVTDKRLDMSPEDEFLQVSILNLMSRKIDPHIHLTKDSMSIKVQECWILMRGNITVSLYDLDESFLIDFKLSYGDIFITFHGGHSFTSSDDALLIEIKNGPYNGPDYRKIYAEN